MILDPQRIEELKHLCVQTNQPTLFKKMIRQFIQSLNESQAELEAVVKINIDRALHTLRGRCGTIGAITLARAVEDAEQEEKKELEKSSS